MDRPLFRLNHPAFHRYLKVNHSGGYWTLRRGERFIIHALKTGKAHYDGFYIDPGSRRDSYPQGREHFTSWENQDKPYPDTRIAWEVVYG